MRAMRKRYLLILLAAIATALLVVLPGTALATQYVTLYNGGGDVWFDLDSGQQDNGGGADLTYYAYPGLGQFDIWLRGSGFFSTTDYDAIGWSDVFNGALAADPSIGMASAPYSFVVITHSGTCFKGMVTDIDTSHVDLQYDQITPDNGTLVVPPWNCNFDLETGTVTDEGYDLSFEQEVDHSGNPVYQAVTTPIEAGSTWAASSVSYDSLTAAYLQGMVFGNQTPILDGFATPPVAVVRTSLGHYFKLTFLYYGWWPIVLYQELFPPTDPPTMLNELKGFITAPASGVDPVIGTSLTAKVNAALAALDRGKEKTALNNLNALLNQVRAQTGKKISTEAADAITTQVEAIIDAINQS